jgi:L-threonylcarbamoyladenylate synthase
MEKPLTGRLDSFTINQLVALLSYGGVAVLPTDTIYGLHCIASNRIAIERIRKLKGRGREGGFILLACSMEMADRVVSAWPGDSMEMLSEIWPAPLTAILPAADCLEDILAPRGRVAVRIPAFVDLRALVKKIDYPLVSTSVNISASVPLTRMSDIMKAFPSLDAYISQRGRPGAQSSTIVDFTARPPKLLRAGRHPWPQREGDP